MTGFPLASVKGLNTYQQIININKFDYEKRKNKINILPVTGFPLGSVTGTATGATVVTSWVTGFPLPS